MTGGITVDGEGAVRMHKHPRVTAVRTGSGAASAGIRRGDVIMSVDGRGALDPAALRDVRPGTRILLVVRRTERELRVQVQTRRPTG